MGAAIGSYLVPLFAVGGDALAGNMEFFSNKPTTPAQRLHLALSVGVLVAGLVESLSARRARYKPFALAGVAAGCWCVLLLAFAISPRSGNQLLDFLQQQFPVIALLAWVAVSVPDVARSVRRREYGSVVVRWSVAAGAGVVAGALGWSVAVDDLAALLLLFGTAAVWGLGLLGLSVWLVVRWRQRRRTVPATDPAG